MKRAEIAEFLASLPESRRSEIEKVRKVIRKNLPAGYEEVVSRKLLVYQVPFEEYSDTYNGQALWYVAIGSNKSSISLHLMPVYGDPKLAKRVVDGFRAAGKKLDMGKACIRFKKADDLALDVIGEIVAAVPRDRWIEIATWARKR